MTPPGIRIGLPSWAVLSCNGTDFDGSQTIIHVPAPVGAAVQLPLLVDGTKKYELPSVRSVVVFGLLTAVQITIGPVGLVRALPGGVTVRPAGQPGWLVRHARYPATSG